MRRSEAIDPPSSVSPSSDDPSISALAADERRRRLHAWYNENRRDLPWRRSRGASPDPYHVWLAEVMLVQTQVETVVPYYQRFLDRFPDIPTLAAAELDEVLKMWEGLGYYARARNLHKAARMVVERHDERLPRDPKNLHALPGIGPYVAAAISSIAFGEPLLAVDANVRRVICRLNDLAEATDRQVRALGTPLIDAICPGDTNQALMDLGSAICTPRSPRCNECPLKDGCRARQLGTQNDRPQRRRAPKRPHHEIAVGIVWRDGEILIAKRPAEGLLGGLWEFPGGKRRENESLQAAVVREVGEELGIEVEPGAKIAAVDHAYSHFSITMHAFHCQYRTGTPKPLGCQEFVWVRPGELDRYAFPAANRRVLEQIGTDELTPG